MESTVEFINGIFICTTVGKAEADGVADIIDEMLSHVKWKPGTPRCYDITDLDSGLLTVNDIKRIVDIAAQRKEQLRVGKAAVVARRDLTFGLSRMMGVYISDLVGSEFQVFRSRDEAISWLSI